VSDPKRVAYARTYGASEITIARQEGEYPIMCDERLPAPWTASLCEHCGREHPPSEDCLPPDDELFSGLVAVFGPPTEIAPGVFAFLRVPKA
jgi:hypothetical protein